MLVLAANVDFMLAAALLQLTRDVWGPLTSAGGFVAMASKEPDGMEARIARLESDVAHIRSDVAEVKTDVRSLRDKMDKLSESLASAKLWALMLYIALAGALFGTLARGFGWI